MLDVIAGCTRKTEVASWHVLFDIVGSPKELFEKCMSLGQLKTAGGYSLHYYMDSCWRCEQILSEYGCRPVKIRI
ncbi:RIC1-domain-containing protein [Lipomyces mesembrius]